MEQSRATRGKLVGFLFVLALAFGLLLGTSAPAWAYMADEPTESSVTLDKSNLNRNTYKITVPPITLHETDEQDNDADLRLFKIYNGSTKITADSGKIISRIIIKKGAKNPEEFSLDNISFSSGTESINAGGNEITVTGINNSSVGITVDKTLLFHYISMVVYYKDPIRVAEVTLDKSTVDLTRGGTETLTAEVQPENATYPTVTWSSSDSKVATVDNTGKISAAGVGTATITATADGKSATCKVTVTYTPEDVMAMINDLPAAANVKTSDKDAIEAARAAFNSLSDANKAKVTNVNKLEAAEAALPKAYFAEHKVAQKAEADKKAKTGDSNEVTALINAAKNAIDKLAYDESKTLDQNKAAVTAIVTKLTTDIADQRAADAVIEQIAALPSADAVTTDDKNTIENARAAYNKLTDARKAKVPASTLKKLTDAEAALKEAIDTAAAQAVIDKIAALPTAENVTADNKAAIEEVRAAYDALTKDQQAKVPTGTLKRLTDAEAAVAAAVVLDKIDALPNARNVTTENEGIIKDARAAYNALTTEQKAWISAADLKKLTDAEAAWAGAYNEAQKGAADGKGEEGDSDAAKALVDAAKKAIDEISYDPEEGLEEYQKAVAAIITQLEKDLDDQRTADTVSTQITTGVPAAGDVTTDSKDAIEAARAAYNELTPEQKEKVDPSILEKLTGAETAWTGAYDEAKKSAAENLGTNEDSDAAKALVNAAKEAIEGVSYDPEKGLDEYQKAVDAIIAKLGTDLADQRAADAVSTQITTSVPAAGNVTASDEQAITDALDAYNALTEAQKAKVPDETLAKLQAAQAALAILKVENNIDGLPSAGDVTAANEEAIQAARQAYNTLTDEQKAKVPSATLNKLAKAEAALKQVKDELNPADVSGQINNLPASDEITKDDRDAIVAARAAYDALTDDQKNAFPGETLQKLIAAENALAGVNQEAADNVTTQIDGLPTTAGGTSTEKESIENARKAYNALTADQKEKVDPNILEKLTAAETAWTGAYDTAKKSAADDLGNSGDSEAAKALVTAAKKAIDDVSYDPEKGLGEYQNAVDEIIAKLEKDLGDQREADTVAGTIGALPETAGGTPAEKESIEAARAAYNALTDDQKEKVDPNTLEKLTDAESAWTGAYDEAKKTVADGLGTNEDSDAAKALVIAAKKAIEEVSYDPSKGLEEYKAAVDAIITKLGKDLGDQRKADTVAGTIDSLPTIEGSTDAEKESIEAARAAYNALTADQKEKVDPSILEKLTAAESAWTGAYDTAKKSAAEDLGTNDDSEAAKALVTAAQDAIDKILYDPEKGLEEYQKAVDAIITQLGTDLGDQRKADSVITQIIGLPDAGNVTADREQAITDALAAYEALTPEQKEKVPAETLAKLKAAEAALPVAKTKDLIDKLPAAGNVTTTNKEAIEAARAAYNALTPEQKAEVPASVLKKLTEAEDALPIAAAKDPISALPDPDKVTTDDQDTIEGAREAYNALTDEQKADVPEATIKKLAEAEAALKKTKGELTPEYAIGLINALPEPASVKPSDRDAIVAARAAYEALDAEKKAAVTNSDKLQLAETALGNANNSAVSIVSSQVSAISELGNITTENKEAIEQARKDYDALTADQKAKLPEGTLQKLETAEAALKVAVDTKAANDAETQINGLPTDNVTPDKAADIEAARTAYDALTPDQKAKLPEGTLEKLEAAEAALKEAVDTAAAKDTSDKVADLPSASKVTPNNEDDIKAAREAYNALTDDQKAKLPEGTLEKLQAAENALEAAKSKTQIASLPAADEITPANKDDIEAARKAYDALTDEQKARIPAGTLAKLEAAEAALEEATDQAAADDASGKVSALPATDKVTASDKAAIEAARKAYNALTPEQKAKLPADTLKKLEAAEAALKDAETAKAASDKVSALPAADKVTASDKAAIQAARKAYDALTPEQKAKLPADTLKKLEAAEKALAEAEKAGGNTAKTSIAKAKVTLAKTSMTFTGKALKPAVKSVALNGKALKASDYSVSYKNNVKPGKATVTVTGKGSYTDSAQVTFTITKASLAKAKVTLAKTSVAYTGKALKPKVKSVALAGKKLAAGTDYTVKYANNKKIGKATVTITGKGSYTSSAKKTFKIVPGKPKVATATSLKTKTATAKWAKVAGAKSYQVQWRVSGGKWKTKTVKAAKATKTTIKGMKAGKLYDFRVRVVAGKAKGAWSATKHRWLAKQAGVKAKSAKSGALSVSWKKVAKANAGYKVVVRYANDGTVAASQAVAAGKTSATIKGLKAGKTVSVQVKPLRKAGGTVFVGVSARAKAPVKIAGKTAAKAQSAALKAVAL